MQLKSLHLRRAESYEKIQGFIGELETESPKGRVTIKLSEESCREIIKLAAAGIMEAAAEVANLMVLDAETPSLEVSK